MADAPLLQGSWASVLLVLPDAPAPLIYLGVVDLNKGGRKKQRKNRQNKENNIVFAVKPPPEITSNSGCLCSNEEEKPASIYWTYGRKYRQSERWF